MGSRIVLHKGEVFNRLTIIEGDIAHPVNGKTVAKCRCECGNTCTTYVSGIRSGKVRSCGCLKSEIAKKNIKKVSKHQEKDLTGKSFGFWVVLNLVGIKNNNNLYLCRCACGNTKEIESPHLIRERSKSCGCKSIELGKGRKATPMPEGTRFGSLVIKESKPIKEKKRNKYKVICDCGEEVLVDGANLRKGQTTHKGCRL